MKFIRKLQAQLFFFRPQILKKWQKVNACSFLAKKFFVFNSSETLDFFRGETNFRSIGPPERCFFDGQRFGENSKKTVLY